MTFGINDANIPLTKMYNTTRSLEKDNAGGEMTALINAGNGDDGIQVEGNVYGSTGDNGEGSGDGAATDDQDNSSSDYFSQAGTISVNLNSVGSGDDIIFNGSVTATIYTDTGNGDETMVLNDENSSPALDPEEPVAANETGHFWGGQQVVGGDNGQYDVQGEAGKIYNLLSDSGLDFRGEFESWGDDGLTAVGETGVTVGEGLNSDYINFRKDGNARINGRLMEAGLIYDLADGGTAMLEISQLTVATAEGYIICQVADGSHINFDVTTGESGVANGQLPGGLLGETFDADDTARNGATGVGAQGEGAINGDAADYECNALDIMNDNRGETAQPGNEFLSIRAKLQGMVEKSLGLVGLYGARTSAMEHYTDAMETLLGAGKHDDDDGIDADDKRDVELNREEEEKIEEEENKRIEEERKIEEQEVELQAHGNRDVEPDSSDEEV